MRRLVLTVLVFFAVGLLPMLCHHVSRGHKPNPRIGQGLRPLELSQNNFFY
jgi:hypothetical protein